MIQPFKLSEVTLDERIEVFDQLGRILKRYLGSSPSQVKTLTKQSTGIKDSQFSVLESIIENSVEEAGILNPWFTRQNILTALSGISRILTRKNLENWLYKYNPALLSPEIPLKIGVIMAGNIPLVGFHDFLCILMAGHRFTGKLSSRDDRLLPMVSRLISLINSNLNEYVEFTDERLSGTDAIIATGSNNTYRYFDYYFGKYPHIFRKNRNGAAILNGNETPDQLAGLGDDIFTYFGLGCRNISKIFVPEKYEFKKFLEALERFSYVTEHNKYMNNYQYFRSVYLLNRIPHYDNGFLLLKQDTSYNSPVGVLFYEYYSSMEMLKEKLVTDGDLLQCITAIEIPGLKTVPFGKTQFPELWDYADNINTIDFLINLWKKTEHDL
jgi:hypothetical protein